jgi:hypothetical protein
MRRPTGSSAASPQSIRGEGFSAPSREGSLTTAPQAWQDTEAWLASKLISR